MRNSDITNELIQGIEQGDEASFRKLYDRFYPHLFAFARTFVALEDAQDVVAEAFFKLWQRRDDLERITSLRGYLLMTVRNSCIDMLRYKKRFDSNEEALLTGLNQSFDNNVELSLLKAEVYTRIAEEVNRLPKQAKLIFELAYFKQFNNEEIADYLGLSVQTVKNQKNRALNKLREAFGKTPLFVLILILLDQ